MTLRQGSDNTRRLLDDPELAEAQVEAAQERLPWADVGRHDASIEQFVARRGQRPLAN